MSTSGALLCDKPYEKKSSMFVTKIASKGSNVSVSFYAFFANKNDDPELLMEAATWWIQIHELDHFVKAKTIKEVIEKEAE